MGKYVSFLIIAIFYISAFFLFTQNSNALELNQALLRLDRMAANTATGGTICAEPASNATEGRIAITFPQGFTVNSNSINWAVNTSNLPSGATPWPGIGTANNVSGQIVTFPSGDLSIGTFYCFNFAGTNTLTTGTNGDKEGTITTQTAAGSTIDSTTYGVTIRSSDQVTITASVPGSPDDFDAKMQLIHPPNDSYNENTELTYKLTYGSNVYYAVSAVIEVEWSLGRIGNSSASTVEILDYVVGSATNAIGNVAPVIDIVNKRISWTVSLPGNAEGEEVTFKLRTNDNYKGSNYVFYDVLGRVVALDTQTLDSTVTKKYLYSAFDAGPPDRTTPTPGAAGGGEGGDITPTPTTITAQEKVNINDIDILSIGANTARIGVETQTPSTLTINYGTNINNLSESINFIEPNRIHIIELSSLSPSTRYYFRITTRSNGTHITSDLFTFATSSSDENIPTINLTTLTFFANNSLLFSPFTGFDILDSIDELKKDVLIVLSTSFPFEFKIGINGSQNVKRIIAYVRNTTVLGAHTNSELAESDIELFESSPGMFSGKLLTSSEEGIYDLYFRIFDINGNISEQKVAKIRVIKPFKVVSSRDGRGIEKAKVTLFAFNPKTKLYVLIPSNTYSLPNPAFTAPGGTLGLSLTQGKYRAEVEILGYEKKTVEFVIGEFEDEKYPTVELNRLPFSLANFLYYYLSIIGDVYESAKSTTEGFSVSFRFFDLIAAFSLTALIATTLFAFSVRTHVKLQDIPLFLIFYIRALILGHSMQQYIHGEVHDIATGKPLSRAQIEIFDKETDKLLSKGITNQAGEFYMKRIPAKNYKILVSKHGYHSHIISDYSEHTLSGKLQFFIENKDEALHLAPSKLLLGGFENLFGISFETLLLICLFFEIIFISTIGLFQTLPFLIITLLTLLMWVFYASRILRKVISPAY